MGGFRPHQVLRDNRSLQIAPLIKCVWRKGTDMAAMKPRTGDGPMECPKEGRGYVLRVPLEGGGRLVVELNAQEVKDLGAVLADTISAMPKK